MPVVILWNSYHGMWDNYHDVHFTDEKPWYKLTCLRLCSVWTVRMEPDPHHVLGHLPHNTWRQCQRFYWGSSELGRMRLCYSPLPAINLQVSSATNTGVHDLIEALVELKNLTETAKRYSCQHPFTVFPKFEIPKFPSKCLNINILGCTLFLECMSRLVGSVLLLNNCWLLTWMSYFSENRKHQN